MELETYTSVSPKLVSRKSNVKFCITLNMISFANAQGPVKIRLVLSRVILIILSLNIVTNSNRYIKGYTENLPLENCSLEDCPLP